MLKEYIKRFIKKYFDYKITGEYYDMWRDNNGVYHYQKKYNKKYFLKKRDEYPPPFRKIFSR